MMWREVAPIKVGLDSSIEVVRAEVRREHGGVHEGQSQASRDAAEKDWAWEGVPTVWGGVQMGARVLTRRWRIRVGPGSSWLVVWIVG